MIIYIIPVIPQITLLPLKHLTDKTVNIPDKFKNRHPTTTQAKYGSVPPNIIDNLLITTKIAVSQTLFGYV